MLESLYWGWTMASYCSASSVFFYSLRLTSLTVDSPCSPFYMQGLLTEQKAMEKDMGLGEE
jgi:hypothetical protein